MERGASDKRGVLNRRFSGLSGVVIRSQWVTDLEQWGRECRLIGVSTLETFSISIDPVPLCSPLLLILTREEESNYRIREFERGKSRLHSMRREGKKIIYISVKIMNIVEMIINPPSRGGHRSGLKNSSTRC